jgi:hypothetical protein
MADEALINGWSWLAKQTSLFYNPSDITRTSQNFNSPGVRSLTQEELQKLNIIQNQLEPHHKEYIESQVSKGHSVDRIISHLHTFGAITAPFSANIGPGNLPQQPKTNVDADALEHDTAYATSNNIHHISRADTNFRERAVDHIVDHQGNPLEFLHGVIGASGIGAKELIEKYTGQLYPSTGNGSTFKPYKIYTTIFFR